MVYLVHLIGGYMAQSYEEWVKDVAWDGRRFPYKKHWDFPNTPTEVTTPWLFDLQADVEGKHVIVGLDYSGLSVYADSEEYTISVLDGTGMGFGTGSGMTVMVESPDPTVTISGGVSAVFLPTEYTYVEEFVIQY
jgi:hypothetical protein